VSGVKKDLPAGSKYWAFISYSHADGRVVRALHAKLERYTVPRRLVGKPTPHGRAPKHFAPICRDREELAGAPRLPKPIKDALDQSVWLIVTCSTSSAASTCVNDEILYFQSLGRGDRILTYIVPGDSSDPTQELPAEAFLPPALRPSPGEATGGMFASTAPLSPDARRGKDGPRAAMLKVVAGMLGVSYGDLANRDQRRRQARVAGVATLALGCAATYVLCIDAGFEPPGAPGVRRALDELEVSVFRGNPSAADIGASAATFRRSLCEDLADVQESNGWFEHARDPSPKGDPWLTGQCLCAWLKAPESTPEQLARAVAALDSMYSDECKDRGLRIERGDRLYGWTSAWKSYTIAEASLWTAAATSVALARPGLLDAAQRERFLAHSLYVQEVLDTYLADEVTGAWDPFPDQAESDDHSNYTATLALIYLLETHAAGGEWHGSRSRLEQLLKATAERLVQVERVSGDVPHRLGWGIRNRFMSGTLPCLSVQIDALLLRAQREGHIKLEPALVRRMENRVLRLATRSPLAEDTGVFGQAFTNHEGVFFPSQERESITFLAFPWIVACSRELMLLPKVDPAAEPRVRYRRLLAALLADERTTVLETSRELLWKGAEVLYALGTFPEAP
jgi:hypothetical protein